MIEIQFGFLVVALIAGVLTVVSPCVLPVLPIVMGGSLQQRDFYKPLRIIGALLVSIIVFSILLKASTVLLGVPDFVWRWLSGGILIIFGIVTFWPKLWSNLMQKVGLQKSSFKLASWGFKKGGNLGDFIIGAALGPVFTSCSPTYLYIVAISLPANWLTGFIYLLIFSLGLALILLLIAFLGQKFIAKLKGLSNPQSWFKRCLAFLLIISGILIATGYDKKIEAELIQKGAYNWLIDLENQLHSSLEP